MKYLRIIDGVIHYPYSIPKLRKAFPNTSFPKAPAPDALLDFGMYIVHETTKPVADVVTELTPTWDGQQYNQIWDYRSYTPEEKAQAVVDRRDQLFDAAYAKCSALNEALVKPYSTAERDTWSAKYDEAVACRDSGYVTVGGYLQAELDSTPGATVQAIADRVYGKGNAFRAALGAHLGARNVVIEEITGATDDEILAMKASDITNHAAWGGQ